MKPSIIVENFVTTVWGMPMLCLLVGGGIFFSIYARLLPYRYLGHSIRLVLGKYTRDTDRGELTHKQALSTALSGTLGLGNIAGVALAISAGGPGAVFWMWITALLGVSTKFFTCSLGVMYRGYDSEGKLQGGPMYIIREGLGPRFKPLAILFAVAGLLGTLPAFQINQLTSVLTTQLFPNHRITSNVLFDWVLGISLAILVAFVIWGGLRRVALVAAKLVPFMTISYLLMACSVLLLNVEQLPTVLTEIVTQAFQPSALTGGLAAVITIGVSRGAFSNEAGIGTEVMAHGAAKTNEPIREGLVGSLGPIVDTLIVCSCTALVILVTGVAQGAQNMQGVTLTLAAFSQALGGLGEWLLTMQVVILSLTTVFTFWYYGHKCFAFLVGVKTAGYFKYLYLMMIVLGAVISLDLIFNFLIGMYGLMAIPTMVSSLLLAPKVKNAADRYFCRFNKSNKDSELSSNEH